MLLAAPRGYCAGVDRAVITVEKALDLYGSPGLRAQADRAQQARRRRPRVARRDLRRGARRGARGRDRGVLRPRRLARWCTRRPPSAALKTIDATCPLVTKVHHEAKRFAGDDYDILLIGHEGHEEVEGTAGEAPEHIQLVQSPDDVAGIVVRDPAKVAWLSQTTLSVDETLATVAAIRERFPLLLDPPSDDICYATQNRQLAVKEIAPGRRPGDRGRLRQLLQLGPAGRGRPRGRRQGGVPRRRRHRDRRGLARGRRARSASPRARRCPRTWSTACWRSSPSAATPTPRRCTPPRSR